MKEIIGKTRVTRSYLPRKILLDDAEIFEENFTANEFNDLFKNISIKLAHKILAPQNLLKFICKKTDLNIKNELNKKMFFSMKSKKSAGYDNLNFNIIKRCLSVLCKPLKSCLAYL